MDVETLRLGPYQTNCYILHNSHQAWIIDPGSDGYRVTHILQQKSLTPQAILLTHTHWDHTLGIAEIVERYGQLPLMVHQLEAQFLGNE